MQAATTLLLSGLLLAMAPAVVAETPSGSADVTPVVGQVSASPADRAALGLEGDCAAGSNPLIQAEGGGDATFLVTQYCGSCSEDQCRGAIRGSSCKVSFGVWGHCNNFSGAVMCTTGRFNCQCRTGDLP